MFDVSGKTVLITGGSRGIGYSIAEAFVKQGANVVISSRSEGVLNEAAESLGGNDGQVTAIPSDVSQMDSIQELISTTIDTYETLDVVINNAGITRDNLMLRMSEDDWDSVIDINLKGTFWCTKIASRQMLKQRAGTIINISSVVGVTGNPGQVNYAASKSGILGLTKSAAQELASRNITVNAIAPGYIETEMTDKLNEKQRDELTTRIPLGRIGSPADIAGLAIFLASPAGSYITGQVFRVDGGMVMG
ncbi:MAG: 3-oxoacyl-[acyl-carrier-protein] reductase [Candidatus Marinimicrobia bacterium]|nr:3-oxoacyl-[acyl-carrier-protein] reductase [Candidatus Neomarinimicrobiota bacterium]